jgi:outer membrane protein
VLAVGMLFYLHFSAEKQPAAEGAVPGDKPEETKKASVSPGGKKILFVNIDTLNVQYEALKDLKKKTEASVGYIENKYKTEAKKFEEEYMAYQQAAAAGIKPRDQLEKMEENLQRKQQEIQRYEQDYQRAMEKAAEENEALKKEVRSFFKSYSRDLNVDYILAYTSTIDNLLYADPALDITPEVVKALNIEYKEKKAKK